MIPLVATVRRETETGTRLWIPLPLFLLWVLLLPFAVLLLPVLFVACLASRVNPFRALWRLWQVLAALRTIRVEVALHRSSIRVQLI